MHSATNKLRGEEREALFDLRALQQGFIVAKPHGDSSLYDRITDFGGRLCRVQIKSRSNADARGRYMVDCYHGSGRKGFYNAAQVDFIAAYTAPNDTWYIVPIAELTSGSMVIKIGSRFDQYANAWHLLKPQSPIPAT